MSNSGKGSEESSSLPNWMTSKPTETLYDQCSPSRRKWVVIGTCGALTSAICSLLWPFISPALRRVCLPYVPATPTQITNILNGLSSRSASSRVLDIGSGDGRVVMATARAGFLSTGVEINPWLVFYARAKARSAGLAARANFVKKDLWKYDVSSFDNVVVFGVEEMMPPLRTKLESELKPGARVVACRFPIEEWTAKLTIGDGVDAVWVYDR